MQTCGFGFVNQILGGLVTADQQAAGLPANNVQSDQGAASTAWRFTSSPATLTLKLAVVAPFGVVSLHRTNLSAAAKVRVRIYNSTLSNTQVYDSGDQPANIVAGQSVMLLPAVCNGDGMLLTITEPSMGDGYVSVPLIFAGPLWQPIRNMSYAGSVGFGSGVDEVTTLSGVEYPQFRWARRTASIDHQSLGAEELVNLRALAATALQGRNVLFLPDPAAATLNSDALYGRLTPSDITNPAKGANRRGTKMTMTERL